jgi:signal transduction histidine kinase
LKKKLKILHLEDLPFDAEMVERELKKANIEFEKLVVDTKTAFENALTDFEPDIILSDHSLPSFNSLAAIKIAKEKNAGIPVILVTATVSEEFAVNALQQGASDYILKTNLKRLPAAVLGAIEKARAIKEKNIAETELKQSYGQLRSLASHLQNVREEERSSIAREVHDELGQQLTAIKLDIEWLMIKLEEAETGIKDKVGEMEKLVITTLKTVKKIVTELHPAILEKMGIIEAIKWQAKEFEKRTGLKILLSLTEEDVIIRDKTAIALFRIVQESFTNIIKHAQASNVSCSLQKWDKDIFLIISDDGKGFNPAAVAGKQSLGILGMKERTVILGGKYQIISEAGKGTKVLVVMPVEEM